MSWLIGGPFLEISLIKCYSGVRSTLIDQINFVLRTELDLFEIADVNNQEEHNKFINDTYIIGENNDSAVHDMRIDLWINICGKRKASLYINQLAYNTYLLEFYFFGSEFDATEWNQIGIRESEIIFFRDLGVEFKRIFKCELGRIAFEDSVIDVFNSDDTWPNESYSYKHLEHLEMLGLSEEYF